MIRCEANVLRKTCALSFSTFASYQAIVALSSRFMRPWCSGEPSRLEKTKSASPECEARVPLFAEKRRELGHEHDVSLGVHLQRGKLCLFSSARALKLETESDQPLNEVEVAPAKSEHFPCRSPA